MKYNDKNKMYLLMGNDLELIKKIEALTFTEYKTENNEITIENLFNIIGDLYSTFENQVEEARQREQEFLDNYKPVAPEEQNF